MTELLLDAIAAWRIVRLIQRDEITEGPRNAYIEWTLDHGHRKLRYLISCPHCLSPYVATLILCLRRVAPRASRPMIRVAALSGFVSMYSEIHGLLEESINAQTGAGNGSGT